VADAPPSAAPRRLRWRRRLTIGALALLAAAVALRLAAPSLIAALIPRLAARVSGLQAEVDSVQLSLLAGGCRLRDLRFTRVDARGAQRLRGHLRLVDCSWSWRALLSRRFVGDLRIDGARITIFPSPQEETPMGEVEEQAQAVAGELRGALCRGISLPVATTLGRVEVQDAVVDWRRQGDRGDLVIRDIAFLAEGISNERPRAPAPFSCEMHLDGGGRLAAKGAVDVLAPEASLDAEVELRHIPLEPIKDVVASIVGIDIATGRLDVTATLAVRDGAFTGRVTPLVHDLQVGAAGKGLLRGTLRSAAAQTAAESLERRQLRVGTEVPVQGRLDDPDLDLERAARQTLKESFLRGGNAGTVPGGHEGRGCEVRGGFAGGAGAVAATAHFLVDQGAGWRRGVGAEAIRFDGGERLAAIEAIAGYRIGATLPLEILPTLGIGYTSRQRVVLAFGGEADVTWSLGPLTLGPSVAYRGAVGRQDHPAAWLGGVVVGVKW
jgi:hypothetical protein